MPEKWENEPVERPRRSRAGSNGNRRLGLQPAGLTLGLLAIGLVACARSTPGAVSDEALTAPSPLVWTQDEDVAKRQAASTGRPILIRVELEPLSSAAAPRDESHALLSHPIWGEAIAREFVSLKKTTSERDKLGWFVQQVGAADGDQLDAPRRLDVKTPEALGAALVAELRSAKRQVPSYVQLLEQELALSGSRSKSRDDTSPSSIEVAIFGMG